MSVRDDYDRDEYAMEAAEARWERERSRRYCVECRTTGGHHPSCPNIDDIEEPEEENEE